jgi:hypothetical protein
MNKTFRGKLADNANEIIRLSTNDGLTGYKIIKFETMPASPGNATQESVMQIFTKQPASNDATVDFTNPLLLAVALYKQEANASQTAQGNTVIFDNKIVNQDIFISHRDAATGEEMNYYLELEQVKLDLNEATVATLKDMRGRE